MFKTFDIETEATAELRVAVRGMLASQLDESTTWRALADMDLLRIGMPERVGGLGGLPELLVVGEELAYRLRAPNYLPAVVWGGTLLGALPPSGPGDELLNRIGEGAAGLAVSASAIAGRASGDSVQVTRASTGARVTGLLPMVLGCPEAEHLLVAMAHESSWTLVAVELGAIGVESTDLPASDLTRPLHRIALHGVDAVVVAEGDIAVSAFAEAQVASIAFLAAEQYGVARRCLDMAADYAKVREQFGRPIGSFQAIQHMLADRYVDVMTAAAAVASVADAAAGQRAAAANAAHYWCSSAAVRCAEQCLQVHGAMGFTWEHLTHTFLRRALAARELLGSRASLGHVSDYLAG